MTNNTTKEFEFCRLSFKRGGDINNEKTFSATVVATAVAPSGWAVTLFDLNMVRMKFGLCMFADISSIGSENVNVCGSNDPDGNAIVLQEGKLVVVPLSDTKAPRKKKETNDATINVAEYMANHKSYTGGGKSDKPRESVLSPIPTFDSKVLGYVVQAIKKHGEKGDGKLLTINLKGVNGLTGSHVDMIEQFIMAMYVRATVVK